MTRPAVLITGCSGLIGTALSRRLASGYELVGLDMKEPPEDTQLDSVTYLDVTSDLSVHDAMRRVRDDHGDHFAAVVHLAAYYDFTGEPSPLYDEITVRGTERLLTALQEVEVERFVFSSTMLVHAPVKPGEHIDEESPLDPHWAYPVSKADTERVIGAKRGRIPVVLLRIAGVYTDVGTQPTLVQQIKRIHQRDLTSFFFPGDSDAGQSLVHLDDAVDAIARSVERRDTLPEEVAILVGEPDPPSYASLQDEIGERIWGDEWPTIRVPEPMAKAGAWVQEKVSDGFIRPYMIELADDHYALDVSRAQELLGWTPRRRLMGTLPGMIRKLGEDPAAWYRANDLEVPEHMEAEPARS